MSVRKHIFAGAIGMSLLGLAGAASAQALGRPATSGPGDFGTFDDYGAFYDYSRGRNTSVLERERPEYSALGWRTAGFTLFPKVETGLGATSNVYAVDTGRTSDTYLAFDPSISARSEWSRHSVRANAGLLTRKFYDETSENETGWYVRGNGQLDMVGESYLRASSSITKDYESRFSAGSPANAANPPKFKSFDTDLRAVYQAGRVRAAASTTYTRIDFHDVRATTGGHIDQDFRDQDIWGAQLRGEYGLTPDAAVFGRLEYSESNYRMASATSRDSKEWRATTGADFDIGALVRGEIGVGYLKREYDAALYPSISGFSARTQVEYFPTQLTTVTGRYERAVQDSVIANSGGYFADTVSARVDHELLRNLLLNASVTYFKSAYQGIDRTDKVSTISAGAQYLMNRSVGIGANLSYGDRNSTGAQATSDYKVTRFVVSLVLQR